MNNLEVFLYKPKLNKDLHWRIKKLNKKQVINVDTVIRSYPVDFTIKKVHQYTVPFLFIFTKTNKVNVYNVVELFANETSAGILYTKIPLLTVED